MSRVEHIGDATLYLGDCREILPTLGKVDAVVTDPPYGINLGAGDRRGGSHGLAKSAYHGYEDTLENFRRVIVPAIRLALAHAERGAVFCTLNLHELPKPDAIGGVYVPAATGRHCWGYASLQPVGFYGVAPDLNKGPRPSAIRSSEIAEDNGHPCPKPLGWMTWLVSHVSRAGEVIFDPFMGSGTTGVAAVKLGRKFIGIEIEPKYFEIACSRIDEATRQGDMFRDAPKPKPVQEAML
jgi:DNA modification methylase